MESKVAKKPSYVPPGLGKTSPPTCPTTNINHFSLDDEKRLHEHYEFGEKLGEGSFGVVWCVAHRATGLKYACKTINKDKVQGQRFMKLIDREVKILKDVSHQNIIELKEVLETTQKIYLILELCEGGELSKLLQDRGPFNETETKIIIEQLARAISYLHKHGKVHRDLKLENILLSKKMDSIENLCIKVTDFGLSIEKGGVGPDNMMDDYCGTPMYMAPEIIEFKSYSEKCDIWAMGVILFKLLNGADDQRLVELTKGPGLRNKLQDNQWSHLSNEVKDCLVGMMRWDPAHRLTADEVLDHPWINGQQLDATKPRNVLEMMKSFRGESETNENTTVDHSPVVVTERKSLTSKDIVKPTVSRPSLPSSFSHTSLSTSTSRSSQLATVQPPHPAVVGSSNGRNSYPSRNLHASVSTSSLSPCTHVSASQRPAVDTARRGSIKTTPGGATGGGRTAITPPAAKPSVTRTSTTTNGMQIGTGRANRSGSTVINQQKSS